MIKLDRWNFEGFLPYMALLNFIPTKKNLLYLHPY